MDRPETIQLLQRAHNEIVTLRRQAAELALRAHAYDTVAAIARFKEDPAQGYGEDVAWRIKLAVETLEAEREAERAEGSDSAEGKSPAPTRDTPQ